VSDARRTTNIYGMHESSKAGLRCSTFDSVQLMARGSTSNDINVAVMQTLTTVRCMDVCICKLHCPGVLHRKPNRHCNAEVSPANNLRLDRARATKLRGVPERGGSQHAQSWLQEWRQRRTAGSRCRMHRRVADAKGASACRRRRRVDAAARSGLQGHASLNGA
jgi:hypothetical protein